ncbi:MAG: DUF4175 domain-containing protein [Gemmatimonadaceae bacterium]|nr:DUF4175 domain-containing protein [Gemmatimonadaceae bacterium]
MTALERVRRARWQLLAAVILTALLWAATLAMGIILLAATVGAIVWLPLAVRVVILPLAALAALTAAAVVLWRGRAARSVQRVALWIEEREPSLKFAFVTAIDNRIAPEEQHRDLHAHAAAADVEGIVRRGWLRALARAVISFALVGAALAIVAPRELLRAAGSDLRRSVRAGPAAPMANRLATLSARVVPPAYTRMSAQTVDEPAGVAALIGSRITFSGKGAADGVRQLLGNDTVEARRDGGEWSTGVTMPAIPDVITLLDRDFRRLVVLEPLTDSAPSLRLTLPERDTTYQTVPRGRLVIESSATDDIGLAYGLVEYMLSSGSGESFDTKRTNSRRFAYGNRRAGTIRDIILLDTMQLAPGMVLHVRAVAFDFNDVTGPGKGVSETRTLRIAEPIDSTSINPAPPVPIDSMWVSQRLLNMRTDTLIRTQRRMERATFVGKSSVYSNDQEAIRQRVLAVIALLEDTGVGDTFETETSAKLRVAADLMRTARMHLGVAEPDTAMPYMKRILAILDEIRLANRYYLRGLMTPVAVNIERVRLTGTDSASADARSAREALANANAALARRIDAVAALARTSPAAAADSLAYIRVAALSTAPAAAAALADAIVTLRRGGSAERALARTRRALEPPPRTISSPTEWGGIAQ